MVFIYLFVIWEIEYDDWFIVKIVFVVFNFGCVVFEYYYLVSIRFEVFVFSLGMNFFVFVDLVLCKGWYGKDLDFVIERIGIVDIIKVIVVVDVVVWMIRRDSNNSVVVCKSFRIIDCFLFILVVVCNIINVDDFYEFGVFVFLYKGLVMILVRR